MPPLPQELVDLVVDHLSDDWRALAACAQAHPDLAPRARSRLQGGTIRLAVDSPNCSDIDDFLRIFSTSSSLITAVCAVSICGRPTTQAASLSESRLPLPTTLIALQHFDHLRSLALRSLIVADYLLFVVFFTQCKSLEALDLESLSIAPADIAEVIVCSHAGGSWGPPSILPKLQTLRIRDCGGAGSASFYTQLAYLLELTRPRPQVQCLSLHLYCPPAVLAYNLQIDRWNETILGMADSLADLSVTLPIPLDQFSLCEFCVCQVTYFGRVLIRLLVLTPRLDWYPISLSDRALPPPSPPRHSLRAGHGWARQPRTVRECPRRALRDCARRRAPSGLGSKFRNRRVPAARGVHRGSTRTARLGCPGVRAGAGAARVRVGEGRVSSARAGACWAGGWVECPSTGDS